MTDNSNGEFYNPQMSKTVTNLKAISSGSARFLTIQEDPKKKNKKHENKLNDAEQIQLIKKRNPGYSIPQYSKRTFADITEACKVPSPDKYFKYPQNQSCSPLKKIVKGVNFNAINNS